MSEGLIGAVLGGIAGGGGFVAKEASNDMAQIRTQEMEKERFENQKIALQMGFDHADQQLEKTQKFQGELGDLTRGHQTQLQTSRQEFDRGENKLSRDQQLKIHQMGEAGQNARSGASLSLQREALNKKSELSAGDKMLGRFQSAAMVSAGFDPVTGQALDQKNPSTARAIAGAKAEMDKLKPALLDIGALKGKPDAISNDQLNFIMMNGKPEQQKQAQALFAAKSGMGGL